jgi:hypothetical protein
VIWGQTRCPIYRSGTFNVQRSTLNFQWGDRKGAWWPGYGDRHEIWTTGLLTRRTCPSAGRAVEAGCGTQIWGQARCPIYRSGTFNVQRSTLNFQRGDRKGAWWPGYGDRHEIWATGLLTRGTCPSAGRAVEAGCGAQIWGQTRCPIYRSGTFNVQRSTLNFQWGDRKGAWWPGYGDRHEIWATGLLTRRDLPKRRSGGRGRLRRPDMGTDTMSDIPIRNVQRPTFNSQLSMG